MSKAAELAKRLEALSVEQGFELIDECNQNALYFDVYDDTMCIMHTDGSVNIIDNRGQGVITTEVISPENILKVLQHYRPFKEVFKTNMQ
ncbi:MAG TPA: hypothetical protein VGN52_11325 [Burkholderiales bacterium]